MSEGRVPSVSNLVVTTVVETVAVAHGRCARQCAIASAFFVQLTLVVLLHTISWHAERWQRHHLEPQQLCWQSSDVHISRGHEPKKLHRHCPK